MPGTDWEPGGVSQYSAEIDCPLCGKKMTLHIGLTGDPKNNSLECIECRGEILPLVPGQIVGGPFPVTN